MAVHKEVAVCMNIAFGGVKWPERAKSPNKRSLWPEHELTLLGRLCRGSVGRTHSYTLACQELSARPLPMMTTGFGRRRPFHIPSAWVHFRRASDPRLQAWGAPPWV